jgi:hypothetical protein
MQSLRLWIKQGLSSVATQRCVVFDLKTIKSVAGNFDVTLVTLQVGWSHGGVSLKESVQITLIQNAF